jgi:RimJ/RimL family protein N-acetyltransferase
MHLEKLSQDLLNNPLLKNLIGQLQLQHIEEQERNGGIYRAIISDTNVIGFITISSEKECMVLVHPDYQRNGIATSALKQMATIAFEERNFDKLIAKTQIDRPSAKLISKFGLEETTRTSDEIFYEYTIEMWLSNNA